MSRPLISIIVPVFNAQMFLESCLNSISVQTFKEWECICVDDDSTDGSLDIIQKFSATDPRFRVIRQTNGGPGTARNNGLSKARGEYFTFIDADDLVHREMLGKLLQLSLKYESDLVVCGFQRFFSDSEFDSSGRTERDSEEDLEIFKASMLPMMVNWRKFRVHPHGKLYKSSFHRCLRFPNLRGPEDAFVSIDIYARSKKAVFSSEHLYGYREVMTGLTQSVDKYRNYIYGDAKVAVHCKKVFSEHGIDDVATEKVAMTYVMRIYHYVNEMAVDPRLSIEEQRSLMGLAYKGICDVRRHVAGRYQVIPSIHYLTFFALKFKLLWLLKFRHRIKRVLKTFIRSRIVRESPFKKGWPYCVR
jgi:glycosyltransferase involved in cell wall biosynthesis